MSSAVRYNPIVRKQKPTLLKDDAPCWLEIHSTELDNTCVMKGIDLNNPNSRYLDWIHSNIFKLISMLLKTEIKLTQSLLTAL